MKRRVFVGGAFAGLGLSGLYARPRKPAGGDIPTRMFGKTGVKLTVVGQGGAKLAYLRTKEDACAHVLAVYDLGVNYFDCARSYWDGHSEEVYGSVLPPFRKELFMTTKSLARTRQDAERELDQSLRTLKTDYVDLWQVHNVQTREDIAKILGPGGAMEAFAAAKRAGKCRFIGFSAHHDPAIGLEMLRAYDGFDTILMPLHAADHAYLSFEQTLLPAAVERGMAIQGMKVFGSAVLLRNLSVRECLSFTLSLQVHAAVVGASSRGQWDDNARIAQSFKPLSADEMRAVRELASKPGIATIIGPTMEYWKRR